MLYVPQDVEPPPLLVAVALVATLAPALHVESHDAAYAHHASELSEKHSSSVPQLSVTVQPPYVTLPVHAVLDPVQYCVAGRERPSPPQSALVQPYSVHVEHAYVDGRYSPSVVSQHTPLVHTGSSQLPDEHP